MNNNEIAQKFEDVADLLAIKGENFRRVLAYRNAAETIRGLERPLGDISAEGGLIDLPGIGKTLAEKIDEMLTSNSLGFYQRLAAEMPASLLTLLKIEGVGPKKVKLFYDSLAIATVEELQKAAEKGELRKLPGMGAKSEEKVITGIQRLATQSSDRISLGEALPVAEMILARLAQLPGVTQTAVGGSLRRRQETIGDIDLLAAADDAQPIMDYFVAMPEVEEIIGKGPTKARIQLSNVAVGVDLRVLPAAHWGTLLSYFTGSLAHNVRLRELAQKHGLSLNEYRFKRKDGTEISCADEEEVYAVLKMPFIPPTLREDRGEVEAALAGELPALIQQSDLISDLHMHSTWSDGKNSILEMAQAAKNRGMKYIVIADHSHSLGIANGLSVERLMQQRNEIREADERMGADFRVLHGTEMEIRADGSLDYPDEILAQLDFVIASLHVSLRQPRIQATSRILNAIDNPHVDMIAHPTGRLLPDRMGADLDMEAIFMAASRTRTILEINANPRRLDLNDTHVRRAIQCGARLAINCDAHAAPQLDLLHFGVATAQRGWATPNDIVNSWELDKLLAFID